MHYLAFHDKKQHGTQEFPAEYYYVDKSHPQYVMPFHWHKEWELIHIVSGSFQLRTDRFTVSAKEGDLLLLPGNLLHSGTPENCVYECFVFYLHGLFQGTEAVKKNLRPVYRMQLLPQLHYTSQEHPQLHTIAKQLLRACKEPNTNHYALTVTCSLGAFFAYILSNGLFTDATAINSEESGRIGQIKSVLEYIEQQYAQPITLQELADVANMNPRYFCRVFKELAQQTPLEYVIHYRIEQAAAMLTATDMPIMDIAMECGFNNYSYFIRTFKHLLGETPKQYRQEKTAG